MQRLGFIFIALCLLLQAGTFPASAEAAHLTVPSAFTESWGHLRSAVRMNHQGTLFSGQPLEEMMEVSAALGIYPESTGAALKGADLLFTIQQPADRGLRAITGWKLQMTGGAERRSATAVSLIACAAADDQGYLAGNWMASFRSMNGRFSASTGIQAGVGGTTRGGDTIAGAFGGLRMRLLWELDAHLEFGGNLETGFALAGMSVNLGPGIRTYFALPVNIVRSDELDVLEPRIAGGVQLGF